jgi:hypothetical protein
LGTSKICFRSAQNRTANIKLEENMKVTIAVTMI